MFFKSQPVGQLDGVILRFLEIQTSALMAGRVKLFVQLFVVQASRSPGSAANDLQMKRCIEILSLIVCYSARAARRRCLSSAQDNVPALTE